MGLICLEGLADVVGTVGLKGHALGRPLKLEKDCYDLYAVCGFNGGGPAESASEFKSKLQRKGVAEKERMFVKQSLQRIGVYFGSANGRGPIAVSRFHGIDKRRQVDSYQRVSTFLSHVQQD